MVSIHDIFIAIGVRIDDVFIIVLYHHVSLKKDPNVHSQTIWLRASLHSVYQRAIFRKRYTKGSNTKWGSWKCPTDEAKDGN